MKMKFGLLLLISSTLLAKQHPSYPNIRAGASLFLDAGVSDDAHAQEIRRARIYLKGKIQKPLSYEIEYDLKNGGAFKDLYLSYKLSNFTLFAGQLKEPFGFEAMTSSRYHTFMERSLNKLFYEDRRLGTQLLYLHKGTNYNDYTTLRTGLFTQNIDHYDSAHDIYNFSLKATYANLFSKDKLWHIGASYSHTDHDGKKLKLSTRPESHMAGKYVKAKIKDPDTVKRFGVELYTQYQRASLQAEYITQSIDDLQNRSYDLSGWYLQLGYFLTDDTKRYKAKKALLTRVKPKHPFDWKQNSWGALEAAFRISDLDVDELQLGIGDYKEYTMGLNWYLTSHARLSANYIISDIEHHESFDTPNIAQIRFGYDF